MTLGLFYIRLFIKSLPVKKMPEERIIELEIKLSYQEDLTQSLNDVIIQQQTQISRLENSLNLLHQNQQNLMEKIGL